jgi:chemosensory pili system protein ChpA (sensor histidine kinase/response regulator)
MTTPSLPSQGMQNTVDTGPLSWVMSEIREALNRSKASLNEALAQDTETQATALRHAKTYLHQAHGALQIVDIDGIAIITETVEDLLDRIEAGQLQFGSDIVLAISGAYQALVEYLEELLSGAQHQPIRLFPYYKALLEARGAERIHPADLFFPSLSARPQLPLAQKNAEAQDYVAVRKRFERALLPFLKGGDQATEQSYAAGMQKIIAEVERLQSNQQSRAFWWVMHGFVEVVATGQVRNELYVKQLFARINLQIRRLSEGATSIAERLLRDALFFIARAHNPSERIQLIQRAYQLTGMVPVDYDKKRYGQIDVQALTSAKEKLLQAKNIWNRIAGGDTNAAESFEQEMNGLASACAKLNSPPLAKLLRELNGIARHAHTNPSDGIGLEMATSLLFVENALNNIGRLPDNFAERADAMTARLLAVVSGEQPAESVQWLDEMSREAQQRQTMGVLVAEMQTSLRHVEKMLDEYFRTPLERAVLSQIEPILHQIEGALSVLGEDDAARAVQHTQGTIKQFAESESIPEQSAFQQVAQNVGALGFFIETLLLQSEGTQKRFSFDEERGVFQANLLQKKESPDHPQVVVTESDDGDSFSPAADMLAKEDELPTVEAELAYHQQQSVQLATSLSAEPDNPVLQEQLKESLEQIRRDATLVDNPDANERAQAAIKLLESPDFDVSHDALAEIISPIAASTQPSPPINVSPAAPESDEAIDAELLEIFLTEADEVLACVRETIPQSRSEPYNQDHLTTLRRSFHTLKGSGRMVGLAAFGEAAWSIEQVLNLRLSETRAGDADLYALLDKAAEILSAWVVDLKASGRSDRSATALVQAAERVKQGEPFSFEQEDEQSVTRNDNIPAGDIPSLVEATNEVIPSIEPELIEPALDAGEADLGDDDDQYLAELPQVEEISLSDADMALLGNELHHVNEDVTTEDITVQATMPEESPTLSEQLEEMHLANDILADVIEFPTMREADVKKDDNVKYIGDLQISVPLHNIYLAETDDLIRVLSQDIAEWRHEPERKVNTQAVHAAHSLAGSSATVGFTPLRDIAYALEAVLQYLARNPVMLRNADYDVLDYSIQRIRFMLQMFALGEMPESEPHQVEILENLLRDLETRKEEVPEGQKQLPTASDVASLTDVSIEAVEQPAEQFDAIEMLPPAADISENIPMEAPAEAVLSSPVSADETSAVPSPLYRDELDADLMPVFMEEGRDLLPQIGQALREWQQKPDKKELGQSLLRSLHTVKGSARMAGAMALGQHMHEMETRIEQIMHAGFPLPQAIDDLLARYDIGLSMFEQLLQPTASASSSSGNTYADVADQAISTGEAMPTQLNDMVELPALMPAAKSSLPTPVPTGAAVPATGVGSLVRVRADILDRLVNQAGEVSISRSKLENEVGVLRQSLSELNENVTRLRDQLREIEMQAESQITSRMSHSADREFDPLEFDRFTRLQELTRMMAESVNDVGSVQQNLVRTIDSASDDLITQARLTRDLQQDLMRVRMVQFASISERLYRVTRQVSKEVGKRVNLDIRGGTVEIDRGVLEKMAGPFEHLLRNAIVHGIESREARQAAGKNETGELLVEIRQEGNEVVIQFADDGQGLNLANIRNKAKAVGLLTDDSAMSDTEVTDLIFHPGFSTADQVTELAGRGVGMDVVRAEAAALGGRIDIASEPGKGAQFTIRLPLTLAVTQVVLLSTGGKTYAVPSVLVEQVQQLKTNSLATAYNDGALVWQGQRVPMYYLSTLLGDIQATPVTQQYSPIMILRSGSERVAVHVDEIQGNREVVVKNIGPQLARMIGVAGATVLGSGEIVLILNPVPLAQRMAAANVRMPHFDPLAVDHQLGAVAEMSSSEPQQSEPVQGLRTQHIVMVVDDSLTVRRVTQRLLVREGYQVVLAKDGVDALEHLQSVTPDVMLVDIEMPRMDGFDLTRNVRRDERTKDIPIIMITSRTATKHRNYAMELGVNEYLGKPYQEDTLLKLIEDFVKKPATTA